MAAGPKIVHKQFNSPMGLYSQQNIKETLNKHMKNLDNGTVGIDFSAPGTDKPANLANSAVLRMLEEEERARRGLPKLDESQIKAIMDTLVHANHRFDSAWPPERAKAGSRSWDGQLNSSCQVYSEFLTATKGHKKVVWPPAPETNGYHQTQQPAPANNNAQYSPQQFSSTQPQQAPAQQYNPPAQQYNCPAQQYNSPTQQHNSSQQYEHSQPSQPSFCEGRRQESTGLSKLIPVGPGVTSRPLGIPASPGRTQYNNQPKEYIVPIQQYNSAPAQHHNNQPKEHIIPIQRYTSPAQQYNSPAQQYNSPAQQYNSPAQQYNSPQQYEQIQPSQPSFCEGRRQESTGLSKLIPVGPGVTSLGSPASPARTPGTRWAPVASPVSPQAYGSQPSYPAQALSPPSQYSQGEPVYQSHQKPFEPPATTITLRQQQPVHQKPSPVFASQPAAASFQGGVNMRGDTKWPPQSVKEAVEAENEARKQLAKGPACRPRKVKKDYTQFFAQNALNSNYPGYRAPPGTQHFEDHSGQSSY